MIKKTDLNRVLSRSDNIAINCYLVLAIVQGCALYHSGSTLASPITSIVVSILLNGSIALFCLNLFHYNKKKLSWEILIPFAYWIISILDSFENSKWDFVKLVQLSGFFLLSDYHKSILFERFRKALIYVSIASLIALACYYLSIPIYRVVAYYTSKLESNTVYLDFYIVYLTKIGSIIQLCGIYNEPGYFGTIIALALCASGFNLKDRNTLVLLAAGLFTLSMAFYSIVATYVIFNSIKNKRYILLIVLAYISIIYVIPNHIHSDGLTQLVERFRFEGGQFAGDNRSDETLDMMALFTVVNKSWWGLGGGYANYLSPGNMTFKTYLIDYGILGFLLMYGSLIVPVFIKVCRTYRLDKMVFLLLFILSVYQRPSVFIIPYFTLLYGGIMYLNLKKD